MLAASSLPRDEVGSPLAPALVERDPSGPAPDRQGLLYVIASALRDLGLEVHASKVATRLDQILDVFYVTGHDGNPVRDPENVETIRRTLVERIERYAGEGAA